MAERRTTVRAARTASVEVESALLGAAERLLEGSGPDALSVRRIAAEAGVAPMGVYSRFGAKSGIVDRLFIEGFDRLAAAVRSVPGSDPLQVLLECCRRYRQLALRAPATYAVMFEGAVAGYCPSEEARRHAYACFHELVGHVARALVGIPRAPGPVEAAQQIWASCHGQVSLELRGLGFVEDVEAHAERLAETVIHGLFTTPSVPERGG